ncbi:telomere-protecting terminal protein Tpg [Streptomyces sp. NPDC048723]|uniref:telomere-protecting terminal protein Tpg n=1 Tax=Streptomyces sp. NPDC048723 TaxID=3365589 RepID=UPI003717E357
MVRNRRRKQAATATGITVETRARFGSAAPIGTSDDGRMRRLTVHLAPAYAQRLFDAQQQGAGHPELRAIVTEGLQETYFKDGGTRAATSRSNSPTSTTSTSRSQRKHDSAVTGSGPRVAVVRVPATDAPAASAGTS